MKPLSDPKVAAGGQIISLDLLNPFNDKEALDDKLSVLDIKARDQSGRQFNLEMQILAYGAFRQRALYYWSRLHQSQLQEASEPIAGRERLPRSTADDRDLFRGHAAVFGS